MPFILIVALFLVQFAFGQADSTEIPFAPEPGVSSSSSSFDVDEGYYENAPAWENKKSDGFWTKFRYIGAGVAGAGLISVIYGVLQHQEFNDRLDKMQAIEKDPRYAAYSRPDVVVVPTTGVPMPGNQVKFVSLGNKSYKDLENEKKGAETRRNIALVFGTLCIGGSIVLFTF